MDACAGQHAGDHHHHPVLGRDAVGKRQPRQVPRSRRFADQPVDHRHHRLGRGKQHQRHRQPGQRRLQSFGAVALQQPGTRPTGCQSSDSPGRLARPVGAPAARANGSAACRAGPALRTALGRPAPCSQCAVAELAASLASAAMHQVQQRCGHRALRCGRCAGPAARCACRVWSRVPASSAANTGEPSISCISGLLRATMSGQSASPMARSEVTALPTLRLSAAWSAPCWSLHGGQVGQGGVQPVL